MAQTKPSGSITGCGGINEFSGDFEMLKEDIYVLGRAEAETLARCVFDNKVSKIIDALLEGDDRKAGRIFRLELEEILRDEAEGKIKSREEYLDEALEYFSTRGAII